MFAYTIRRLLVSIPVLLAASFLTFWFVSLSGDPVLEKFAGRNPRPPKSTFDHEYHRLHLDEGFFAQYWGWLKDLVTKVAPNFNAHMVAAQQKLANLPK